MSHFVHNVSVFWEYVSRKTCNKQMSCSPKTKKPQFQGNAMPGVLHSRETVASYSWKHLGVHTSPKSAKSKFAKQGNYKLRFPGKCESCLVTSPLILKLLFPCCLAKFKMLHACPTMQTYSNFTNATVSSSFPQLPFP